MEVKEACQCDCCKIHRRINASLLKKVDLAWEAARTWKADSIRASQLNDENKKLKIVNKRLRNECADKEN